MTKGMGVWIPLDIAVHLPRLALRPPSMWQVFIVILTVWCRYGCREARLGIRDLSEATGLSRRAVQTALSMLISNGLVRRIGRRGRLEVVTDTLYQMTGGCSTAPAVDHRSAMHPGTAADRADSTSPRGADKVAPPRRTQACASPISIYVQDKREACELLRDLWARADRADFGVLDNDYRLDDLRRQWIEYCDQTLRPRTVTRYRQNLTNIFAGLSCSRVDQLNVEVITTYRKDRLALEIAPRTVNMEVGALSTMLTWGARHGYIGNNPMAQLAPLPDDSSKEGRALSPNEVSRLLDAATPHYRPIWYAFLVSGLRRDEIVDLVFSDVDWENRELVVRRGTAKNHTVRRVPIDDELYEILQAQRAASKGRVPGVRGGCLATARITERFSRQHVFVTAQSTPLGGNLYREFMRTCRRAGIETQTFDAKGALVEHVDLHSLRRTFATNLIENGADPRTVQELLGHKTLAMTMRIYTKVRSQTKRQVIGRLSYGRGAQSPGGSLSSR